jgi:hypothetical protein
LGDEHPVDGGALGGIAQAQGALGFIRNGLQHQVALDMLGFLADQFLGDGLPVD